MVRHQAGPLGFLWEVTGTHPGAAPAYRGPPEYKAQKGETLVLPVWGRGSQGGKEGVAILVPHPPFPTTEGGGCWSRDFPEQQKVLGNQRQLQGGADSRPPLSSLPLVPALPHSHLSACFPPARRFSPTAPPPHTLLSLRLVPLYQTIYLSQTYLPPPPLNSFIPHPHSEPPAPSPSALPSPRPSTESPCPVLLGPRAIVPPAPGSREWKDLWYPSSPAS